MLLPGVLHAPGEPGGFFLQYRQGALQHFRVRVQQLFQVLPGVFCQVRQRDLGGVAQLQPLEGRAGLREPGMGVGWRAGSPLLEQKRQQLDFRGGGRALEVEVHVLDGAQEIGVAGDEHGREATKALRKNRGREQPDDALHQLGLARQRQMVGRVVRLDEEQRPLEAHQAQLAARHFAQHAAEHEKGWGPGRIRRDLVDLLKRALLVRRQVRE